MLTSFYYGCRNLWRWLPVIWNDRDWDWVYLLLLIQFKLKLMSDAMNSSDVSGKHRNSRQMRVCVDLLRRMTADDYFKNANARHPDRGSLWVNHWKMQVDQDQSLFLKILGKHLREWWF